MRELNSRKRVSTAMHCGVHLPVPSEELQLLHCLPVLLPAPTPLLKQLIHFSALGRPVKDSTLPSLLCGPSIPRSSGWAGQRPLSRLQHLQSPHLISPAPTKIPAPQSATQPTPTASSHPLGWLPPAQQERMSATRAVCLSLAVESEAMEPGPG